MADFTKAETQYNRQVAATARQRSKWMTESRFGMFVHFGLFSQAGRQEWSMAHERPTLAEYEALADGWNPRRNAARAWARLARRAGMKYVVMTTKHHEGFLLWDSAQSDYNAARRGPKRDLVAEFVAACRAEGLRVGLYYSLMDWHHPDGYRCLTDEAARRRFLDYTQGCVRELCSNYGKLDILWYDVSSPLKNAEAWESLKMNRMVRRLQPGILINNRSMLPEDFGTPEGEIKAEEGRVWETCMTFNSSWGWQPAPPEDWHSVREIINSLRTCTAKGGNLLFNVGPEADGTITDFAAERLLQVGRWLKQQKAPIYGKGTPSALAWTPVGQFTRKGNTAYYWVFRWPGPRIVIGGLTPRPSSIRLLQTGKAVDFSYDAQKRRLVMEGLPETCPDPIAGVALIEIKFKAEPKRPFPFFYMVDPA